MAKYNVVPHHRFFYLVGKRILQEEFPHLEVDDFISDAAMMATYNPVSLNGLLACGNLDGDYITDSISKVNGSAGLMHSASFSHNSDAAFFESGAGTASDIKNQNKANPMGRCLAGAMLLRHIGANKGAEAVENAVWSVIKETPYRTGDLNSAGAEIVSCSKMGELIKERI
jgi:3-isopropylmalate dehydrogenase